MLKMLSAYNAATKRMNIVNSFKRAGIISDYSDGHLKMYVDINAADVFFFLNEYPENKNNPRFYNLVYSYPIKKILCEVVIIDIEIRDRNDRYTLSINFTIDTQRSSMILDDIRNNPQQYTTRHSNRNNISSRNQSSPNNQRINQQHN